MTLATAPSTLASLYNKEEAFTNLGDGLWLGGFLLPHHFDFLAASGVFRVLSVAKECPDDVEYGSKFVLAHFGFRDHTLMEPWLAALAVRTLREMHDRGPTYVHCAAGISRSPIVVALYLWATGKFPTVSDAVQYLKKLRPIVAPNAILHDPVLRAVGALRKAWRKKR